MSQIRKMFVRFQPHVYEESRFLQDCSQADKRHCGICRVILMRDRFLGEEFHRKIEAKRNINPYILLVDSAGCNLNCWFCYAHDTIKREDYECLDPIYNTPTELAECFVCKMKMSKKLSYKDQDRFFSRIRITGGEPLYSTKDTIVGGYNQSPIEATIDYYLELFKELDSRIGDLLNKELISLSELQRYSSEMSFPTWLTSRPNRINVRFDTNGLIFDKRENAKRFIEGVRDCLLKHLRIEVDYSLKGAAPIEFQWASHRSLPVDSSKTEMFDIQDHPQYQGLMNIIEIKEELKGELADSFSLTIERGINHGKTNGYINFPGSLNWRSFIDRLNHELELKELPAVELSDVDNPMRYANQHGYLFKRYHSRGACIRVRAGNEVVDYLPSDLKDKEVKLLRYIKQCKNERRPYTLIFFPYIKGPYDTEQPRTTMVIDMEQKKGDEKVNKALRQYSSGGNIWVLTGKMTNWEWSIDSSIWGVKEKHRELWDVVSVGDFVAFYVSKPVGGLIGCGRITLKSYDTSLTWGDEVEEGRSKYPYRLMFSKIYVIPKESWLRDAVDIRRTPIEFSHGINLVEDKVSKDILLNKLKRHWDVSIT